MDSFGLIYGGIDYAAYFTINNNSIIKNCINRGSYRFENANEIVCAAAFVVNQYGTMENCVNTGDVYNSFIKPDPSAGVAAIAYKTSDDAIYKGVYNLGEVTNVEKKEIDKALNGLFFRTEKEERYPDLSRTRNYR